MMCSFALVVVAVPVLATAADPQESYSQGLALVEQGNLRDALYALADALRADRANKEYERKFMLVRQAVMYQNALAEEQNEQQWLQIAQALRSFYVGQGVHAQALKLDQQIHQREHSPGSAIQLAESQLALGMNAAAEKTLTDLETGRTAPAVQALQAIAMARQNKLDQARQIVAGIDAAANNDPGTLYCVSRAAAVVGNGDDALAVLTRCFQATPPSRLAALKSHAEKMPDFASLASLPGFSQAMQTESKIVESACSGGSSCAGCPMRGQCASGG
jgi:tetratricopeptide (TPR) repeat protein